MTKTKKHVSHVAFTMAEILLSLTIIGVVAAITLPSLTGNINERTWNTQRKALYARMSQAIALMPNLNGYGIATPETSEGAGDAVDTTAETFVTAGLAKVLKINNICDSTKLPDCGVPDKVMTLSAGVISPFPAKMSELNELMNSVGAKTFFDTKAVAFETANGETIVTYYRPDCAYSPNTLHGSFVQYHMCANFVYDLNGKKGPNTYGKDIGAIMVMYPTDSIVVAPMPVSYKGNGAWVNAGNFCRQEDGGARLPNVEEAAALFVNRNFLNSIPSNMWTSTVESSTKAYRMITYTGQFYPKDKTDTANGVYCIQRN